MIDQQFEEALALARRAGDALGRSIALGHLGRLALTEGDAARGSQVGDIGRMQRLHAKAVHAVTERGSGPRRDRSARPYFLDSGDLPQPRPLPEGPNEGVRRILL